jgi:hypothetical protein
MQEETTDNRYRKDQQAEVTGLCAGKNGSRNSHLTN